MSLVRAVFNPRGRGLRREYGLVWFVGWVVLLTPYLVDWAFRLSEEQQVGSAIGGFGLVAYQVVVALAAIRRLHDTDHSGWWLLIPLVPVVGSVVLFILLTSAGTPGLNRYGADPHPGVPPSEQVYPVKQPKSTRAKVIDGFWWLAFAVVFSLLIVAIVNR